MHMCRACGGHVRTGEGVRGWTFGLNGLFPDLRFPYLFPPSPPAPNLLQMGYFHLAESNTAHVSGESELRQIASHIEFRRSVRGPLSCILSSCVEVLPPSLPSPPL